MIVPPSAILLTRNAEGAVRGCVQVGVRRAGVYYLGMLAVDPGQQGTGLGRAIVRGSRGARPAKPAARPWS